MATTNTNFYYNTTINGSATAGALSCSSLTNTGTLSSTSAATMGALSCSSVSSLGAINSSGAFSCGTNAATVGALSCSTIATSSGIVCGALTASGQIVGDNITSSGAFTCGTSAATMGALSCSSVSSLGAINSSGAFSCGANAATVGALTCSTIANSSGLVCGALTSSGSMLTYGQFSRATSMYNPPIETGYAGIPGVLELRGQDPGHGNGIFFNSSYNGVNRKWRTVCYGVDGTYRIRDDTAAADRIVISASGTITSTASTNSQQLRIGKGGIDIFSDDAPGASVRFYSSSNASFERAVFGIAAGPTNYFSNSSASDLCIRNTNASGRILLGVNSTNANVIITPSGFITNGSNINLLSVGNTPIYNSTTLSWSWQNSDGRTYLINQRGSGQGGFSLGLYDTNNSQYSEFIGTYANFNSSADSCASDTYIKGTLSVSGKNVNGKNIAYFINSSMTNYDWAGITIGRGDTANGTDIIWKNNGGSPFGEINVSGTYQAITYDAGHVSIGSAPTSYTFNVNGSCNVVGTLTKGGGSFLIDHPDPAKPNWKLRHCFVESNTRGDNIYRFEVTASGDTAIVELPSYFKHINENVYILVNAKNVFGTGYGALDEARERAIISVSTPGTYYVVLIGTRTDKLMRDFWDEHGAEIPG